MVLKLLEQLPPKYASSTEQPMLALRSLASILLKLLLLKSRL